MRQYDVEPWENADNLRDPGGFQFGFPSRRFMEAKR